MYVAEIIYRLSYCQLVRRLSPTAFFAVVEFSNPALCGYDRIAWISVIMLGYECYRSFARPCEVVHHSLYGKPLTVWNPSFLVLHFDKYIFCVVILNQSIKVRRVDTSVESQALEINELSCVVRIFDSTSFRNYHPLICFDGL